MQDWSGAIGVRPESTLASRDEAELELERLQAAAELEARQQWLADMEEAADAAQQAAAEEVYVGCQNCGRQLVEGRLRAHQWVCTPSVGGFRATVVGPGGPPTALASWPEPEVVVGSASRAVLFYMLCLRSTRRCHVFCLVLIRISLVERA